MVTRWFRRFLREDDGISLTEAMFTFPIVMLAFAAFVEFGYAMFQWNQTVKALHYGARLAAVSDPIASDFDRLALAEGAEGEAGNTIPIVDGPWTCGPDQANCNAAGLARIVNGSGSRPGMADLNPRIGLNNVVVRYERSGLGYYGRPDGAIVTMRLTVDGITFDLPVLGALLGLDQITIPAMPVTVTSEDLDTTPS